MRLFAKEYVLDDWGKAEIWRSVLNGGAPH